jgi:hypothetical protein
MFFINHCDTEDTSVNGLVREEQDDFMTEKHDEEKLSSEEAFEVGFFRPEDAEGIVALFHSVYGEHYPIRMFYDPASIIAANEEGRYYSIVARSSTGEIVGTTHLFRSSPCPALYENGVGLVRKGYRNAGVFREMSRFLFEDFIPAQTNIETTWGQAICNHPYSQQSGKNMGHICTALEVAVMPAKTYGKEQNCGARVATLDGFRCICPKPHRIFLPVQYARELNWIYSRLDDLRDRALSEGRAPTGLVSRVETHIYDAANAARIMFSEIGGDFARRLVDEEKSAEDQGVLVFQVYVNLASPWVGEAIAELQRRGYFFGGVFPRWFDKDGLMMQRILGPTDLDFIVLIHDDAKQLLEIIRKDWERTIA